MQTDITDAISTITAVSDVVLRGQQQSGGAIAKPQDTMILRRTQGARVTRSQPVG